MGLLLLVVLAGVACARLEEGKWDVLGDAPKSETVGLYLSLRHDPAKLATFNAKVRARCLCGNEKSLTFFSV